MYFKYLALWAFDVVCRQRLALVQGGRISCLQLSEPVIPAVMVKYGLTRVQFPLWLQQSLINGISRNGMSLAIVVSKYMLSVLRPVEVQCQ